MFNREEPYTLAMTLHDAAASAGTAADLKILATDISTRVLDEAKAGLYPSRRIAGIPQEQRDSYMRQEKQPGRGDEEAYRVTAALKKSIVFRRMNLSQPPFGMTGPMDMIFCRNVMIYFDDTVRGPLLEEFHRLLRPDGFLMVGHAESLTRFTHLFERDGSSVYRPVK